MKRYYLLKIYQTTDGMGIPAYRHHAQVAYPNVECLGGNISMTNGVPDSPAILVMIAGVDHALFRGDPKMVPIPDAGLGLAVGSLSVETKLQTKAAIIALGFDADETENLWQNTTGMRAILNHYGRKHNPDFDSDKFDLYQN